MNRSRLMLTLVPALAAMLVAASASASGIPSPTNSTVPVAIRLVGAQGTTADAVAGQFTIVLRTLANNPLINALVALDFSQCPDLEFCPDQLDANATVMCAARAVRKFTDSQGQVQFVILGHSHGPATADMALERVNIFGNGALVGTPEASAFDLDGVGGVGANDLSVWLSDFGSGLKPTRSDYDASGDIGAGDLSIWLGVFAAGGSIQSCASSCP